MNLTFFLRLHPFITSKQSTCNDLYHFCQHLVTTTCSAPRLYLPLPTPTTAWCGPSTNVCSTRWSALTRRLSKHWPGANEGKLAFFPPELRTLFHDLDTSRGLLRVMIRPVGTPPPETPLYDIPGIYIESGLASIGDDAVKHASHCVSLTTKVPFFLPFFFFDGHRG